MNKSISDMIRSFRAGTYNLKKVGRDDDDCDQEVDAEDDEDDNDE
jgi:hypothetical protein